MRFTTLGLALMLAGTLSTAVMAEDSEDILSDEQTTAVAESAEEQYETRMLSKQMSREEEIGFETLAFLPYGANYFVPVSYYSAYGEQVLSKENDYKPIETEFQFSLKFPLHRSILMDNDMAFIAYTQRSYWQLYTTSSPFRETNYQPEIVYSMKDIGEVNNVSLSALNLSFNHQSNGQSGELSRSWNRLIGTMALEYHRFTFGGQVWWRVPESASVDDNPDITDYLGDGQFLCAFRPAKEHLLTLRLQNHLESSFSKGSSELTWSIPIKGSRLKWYLKAFAGYGDSLADYNRFVQRYSIGFAMSDIL